MAGTAVLERELNTLDERATKVREVTFEEQTQKTPSAFYEFLRTPNQEAWTSPAARENFRTEVKNAQAPAYDPTVERVKSYFQAPAAPAQGKKVLFEDYEYINGELMQKNPDTEVMTPVFGSTAYAQPSLGEAVFQAPAYAEPKESVASAATVEREEEEGTEDDALPTRRTMETVIRPAATVHEMAVTDTRTGFKAAIAALSTKTKVILVSVVTAIVLAIVLICVNTSIIRSLDSDLTDLKGRASEEQSTYEYLQKESNLYTDPDSEIVSDWAQSNGMTK